MIKSIFTFTLGCAFCFSVFSQSNFKVYTPQASGPYALQNILQNLIGDGIILKNYSVSKTWSDEAYGYFEDSKSSLGMKKGLIMTTGGISGLCGKNTQSGMSNYAHSNERTHAVNGSSKFTSPSLENLLLKKQKTYDAVSIEMDVIPTADTLNFKYVFGSEEYDEYVGTAYNDAFAFFISGKNITGQENLAVVPGTNDPVSVNSINGGSQTNRKRSSNETFYVSNKNGEFGIEYDGLTKLMEIKKAVVPYETYHIILTIADVADNIMDSGVLLEGKSIVSYEKSYNVLFDKNKTELNEEYKNMLNALVKEYKEKTNSNISIIGHTDNEGDEELNKNLSCDRATQIKNYFISRGIAEKRLIVDCKGETQPSFDNTSEKGKTLNRRVEIKLLGNDNLYQVNKTKESGIAAEKSSIINNVPNPFAQNTSINMSILSTVKNAQVVITNLEGKQLKTVYVLERGNTNVNFESYNLVNGVYIANLICDGAICGSIKMILEK